MSKNPAVPGEVPVPKPPLSGALEPAAPLSLLAAPERASPLPAQVSPAESGEPEQQVALKARVAQGEQPARAQTAETVRVEVLLELAAVAVVAE